MGVVGHPRNIVLNENSPFEHIEQKYLALLNDREFLKQFKPHEEIILKKSLGFSHKDSQIREYHYNDRLEFLCYPESKWYRYNNIVDFNGTRKSLWYYHSSFISMYFYNQALTFNCTDDVIKNFL